MHFKELIKEYQSKGFGSEKKMWEAVCVLEGAMMVLKEKSPDVYGETMRDIHEVFCGPHYNEHFAKEDVSKMHHKSAKGETVKGEHWTMEQIASVAKNMNIPNNANIWDVYVALHANWHDKEVKFNMWFGAECEQRIVEDAVNFYFMDLDAPEGKVWKYMDAMYE